MTSVLNTLLGWDVLPGWFVVGALPALHAVSYYTLTSLLLPWMTASGLGSVQRMILASTGHNVVGDRLALSAVLCSLLLHLLTFYPFLFLSSATGVDNQDPRKLANRPTDGSLKSRLYAGHLNQLESLPGFAAAVLASVVMKAGSTMVTSLAWCHVAFRVAYYVLYAVNIPNLRTLAFVASSPCTVLVFLEALKSAA